MKIIYIIEGSDTDILTADRTDITADNTDITADASFRLLPNDTYEIVITPRQLVNEVILETIHELTKDRVLQTIPASNNNGKMYLTFELLNVKEGDLFKATVFDTDDNLLWRGKILATTQTNIQDYTLNVPNNNGIIIL
jgi:hypothetical protein